MGSIWYWIGAIIVFGVICGGLYIWLYGKSTLRQAIIRYIISSIIFSVVAAVLFIMMLIVI